MAQGNGSNYDVKRGNYFQGMMLVDQDFKDEQVYHRQMRYNHNLELHTWGVVRGLEVTLNKGVVNVGEGIAIGSNGKEIWWKGGAPAPVVSAADGSYLIVEWSEEYRDEYPPLSGKSLRLIDTARFSVKTKVEDNDVVLAQFSSGQADNSMRRIASSVRANQSDIEIRPVTKGGSLRFMTGATLTERLTIDSAGNVGIGTQPKEARLSIQTNAGPSYTGTLMDFGVSIYGLRLGFTTVERDTIAYHFDLINGLGKRFDKFLVFHKGNVGIGVTNPQAPLEVKGDVTIRQGSLKFLDDNGNQIGDWIGIAGNIDGDTKWLHIGGVADREARRLCLAADKTYISGNVGIGTPPRNTSLMILKNAAGAVGPVLTLQNNAGGAGSGAAIDFNGYDVGINGATARISSVDDTKNSSSLVFSTKVPGPAANMLTERLRIKSDGNVGIGTNNPSARLALAANGASIGILKLVNTRSIAGDRWWMGFNHNDDSTDDNDRARVGVDIKTDGFGRLFFTTGGAKSQQERMRIDESGNVGIGTLSPGERLDVRSSAADVAVNLRVANSDATGFINFYPGRTGDLIPAIMWRTNTPLRLATVDSIANTSPVNFVERVRISNDGNVGIGADPGENRLAIFCKLGSDDASGFQHKLQLEIRNGLGDHKSRSIALGVLDNGRGVLQAKERNVGYNDLLLNPAGGMVGIGTSSPSGQLEIKNPTSSVKVKFGGTNGDVHHLTSSRDLVFNAGVGATGGMTFRILTASTNEDLSKSTDLMSISPAGDVRITGRISCGGRIALKTFHNTYVAADGNKSLMRQNPTREDHEQFTLEMACSREFKENISGITAEEAMTTLQALNPIRYDYKGEKAFRQNLGFIAEEMPDNLASEDRKSISPFEVIPVLTRVAKDQQEIIARLQEDLRALQEQVERHSIAADRRPALTPSR